MFVVQVLNSWNIIASLDMLPLPEIDVGKMIGFLAVFETEEDAREVFPEAELKEIKEVG